MKITLIATVLNEADSIQGLMDSILQQTRLPDEVVIVDGGSKDGTLKILHWYLDKLNLQIIVAPGISISRGRNLAIVAAHGDIIVATDAGLTLSPTWVEALCNPFADNPDLHAVGGFFKVDAQSWFEVAMGAVVTRLPDEIDPQTFLPGSRSIAFRKEAWRRVGRYPEWLDFGEDMVFVLNLKRMIPTFAFAPEAVVHFRPRSSIRAFFRQYYHYATGDGKAGLWPIRHLMRYTTYCFLIPTILWLGALTSPLLWLLILPGAAVYLYHPYRRLFAALADAEATSSLAILYTILLIPFLRIVGDVAKMLGYPAGLYWRWHNCPPSWRTSEA